MMQKPADWIKVAHDDLRMTELAIGEDIFGMACFHAQQAAEKTLKGFLIVNNVNYPQKHDLIRLNRLCRQIDSNFVELKSQVTLLNQFYMPSRYPDAAVGMTPEGMPTKETARKALDFAREVVEFCSEKIKQVEEAKQQAEQKKTDQQQKVYYKPKNTVQEKDREPER
ncbi:MAG: HEPN domain-containing protein [Peptococcaceae bacterium]|jgi:HEPN domain-containing protein|nr:HEPN domain-containing protein [Peptococcaceae bacterium]